MLDQSQYLDSRGRADRLTGGVQMVPIHTDSGPFRVWTKRVGNNPELKLLLLHGGPGATHDYLEAFDSYLPSASVEFYYYDQLGAGRSDHPPESSLWELDRFVDEVEQVRVALDLGPENFVLYGHSWGGLLAIEYALTHPDALRGLVISNMMASAPEYAAYAENVLMPRMDADVLAEIKTLEAAGETDSARCQELLIHHYYEEHVLRMPRSEWPEPLTTAFAQVNPEIYVSLQGPSEMGMSADAKLAHWDRTQDLGRIQVATLVIGAEHDTMDSAHLRQMAAWLPNGRYHHCPNGSHMALYDDQDTYFAGLIDFLAELG